MKKSLFLFLLINCATLGQIKVTKLYSSDNVIAASITIENASYQERSVEGAKVISFSCGQENNESGKPVLPSSIVYLAIPPFSKVKASLSKQVYDQIQNAEPEGSSQIILKNDSTLAYQATRINPKFLTDESYPKEEVEILGYQWMGNFYCAIVKINSSRFFWQKRTISMLHGANISFSFSNEHKFASNVSPLNELEKSLVSELMNKEEAIKWRSFNPVSNNKNSSSDWIDFTKEYVKLAIPVDGLYRISFQDLLNYGLNPQTIVPKTLKVFNKGVELPIYFSGTDNLNFQTTDYIEFFATYNYSGKNYREVVAVKEDYKNYLDRYTDTTFLWLTWDGLEGVRIPVVDAHPINGIDTLDYHKTFIHFEKDARFWYYDAVEPRTQIPNWQEHKVWTWSVLGNSGSQAYNFSASNIYPNSTINATARFISNASNMQTNAHKLGVSLNSTTVQDSIKFNFRQTVNFSTQFPSALLKAGTNVLRFFGMPTEATFHQSLLDWIDLDYVRFNYAINDSLTIIIPDSINKSLKNIIINNISSENILLYKVFPELKKIGSFNYDTITKSLIFSDSVSGGDKYICLNVLRTLSPKFKEKKQFINLKKNDRGADNIIITNRILENSVQNYKIFLESAYPLRSEVVYVNDIYDEFGYGYPTCESIRSFLMTAAANWGGAKPSYLTLVGNANYDYKDIYTPAPAIRKKNLVPAYGNPVSDSWYAVWDTSQIIIPQMFVGRIPANNDDQVNIYLNKHMKYLNKKTDDWNKRFLLFSGGDPAKPSELAQIKSVNDDLFGTYMNPAPIGGIAKHFYKTSSPVTNFGPYSPTEIQQAIDSGAIVISYVGHSGTQTWDNGIVKVEDLKNKFDDRLALISDFGCSTGKFAEPDVDAFGELFICGNSNGQAINYLGNSSWGYLSTSLRFPIYFYQDFFRDSTLNVGKAHFNAKLKQFQLTGASEVNIVFSYCNLLFGDPIINLKLPSEPNLIAKQSSIKLSPALVNDFIDLVKVTFTLENEGRVPNDSVKISFSDKWNNLDNYYRSIVLPIPLYQKEVQISIPVKGKAGVHYFEIKIDSVNTIMESNENDNITHIEFNVTANTLRGVVGNKNFGTQQNHLNILNPISFESNNKNGLLVSLSDDKNFANAVETIYQFDTLITSVPLNNLIENSRYFWRTKLNHSQAEWSEGYSFINSPNYNFIFRGNPFPESISKQNVKYDSVNNSWTLDSIINKIEITSAGSNEGKFASLMYNGSEELPNTFFWGVATAILDSVTYKPTHIKYFQYPNPPSGDSLAKYINNLAEGTIVAMAICDDAAQSVIGFSGGTPARKAIATLGSYYIDSVKYRESWCIVGKKGSPPGSALESYKKIFEGQARIEVTKAAIADSGTLVIPSVLNVSKLGKSFISYNLPSNSRLTLLPVFKGEDGILDTLETLSISDSILSLENMNNKPFSEVNFSINFYANNDKIAPSISSVALTYLSLPELAINYQVVSISRDTLYQGDSLDFKFYVYNVGESPADSFRVLVDVMKEDNSSRQLLDTVVTSLDSMQRELFTLNYMTNATDGKGNMGFKIKIDPENRVRELYNDNNEFTIPFFTKPDTNVVSVSASSVSVTFDNAEILNGDFVSSNPNIKVDLKYPTWFAVSDTASLSILLDNERIPFNQLNIKNDSANRTLTFEFVPVLSSGEHQFKIFGNNVYGKLDNQPGFERVFLVSNELAIMNCYNYPNPVKDNTYFTFKLPQLPEELTIRVYTIAGRLVKEIKRSSAELSMDFNRIFWDTKDQDGDQLANGVYLYKVIAKKNGKSESITQKLAIVK